MRGHISEYERRRDANIVENERMLKELGLETLTGITKKKKKKPKKKRSNDSQDNTYQYNASQDNAPRTRSRGNPPSFNAFVDNDKELMQAERMIEREQTRPKKGSTEMKPVKQKKEKKEKKEKIKKARWLRRQGLLSTEKRKKYTT